ncbi:hypothetical protein PLICRDRAFT_62599, partial [Plicaturopsis crispa FD-325 SS-3]
GVESYPRKVTRRMSGKKLAVRNKVKPFIKPDFGSGGYSHLFTTRCALELEGLKGSYGSDAFKEPSKREDAKKTIKDSYAGGKN